ncbi:hypothetical protein FOMPIDRAFT_88593 [Fomitopsis schrenkii]|uniref:Uncharacterized protein n=1 Tax=Fomitopsis schrenkii TaxID=2126942 RepID=S8E3L4_FOMSC|nr:hypothetical protein FOMPIDRAFT_88593 [Fomitopsis schrenkii]
MPGQWTLEEGMAFTTQIVDTLGAKVTRKPFKFIRNEKIPTKWTAEDIKKLNHVVWALLRTPLTWEAIEVIWKTYIMSSDCTLPHLLFNLFEWLYWDHPGEGAWLDDVTFKVFNLEWRDVTVHTFDENSPREEQEEVMQAFADIWIKGRQLSDIAPPPPSDDDEVPEYCPYKEYKTWLVSAQEREKAENEAKEYLAKKAVGKAPKSMAEWPLAEQQSVEPAVEPARKRKHGMQCQASAAAAKKQKQAKEKRRQQDIQQQNAVMLQEEEPGSGEPEEASHDKSFQPDAGPSKKTALKGPLKKGTKRPAVEFLEAEVSDAEGQSSRKKKKTKGKEASKKGPQGKPALKTSRAEMRLCHLNRIYSWSIMRKR